MADSTTPAQSSLLGSQSDSQRTLYPYVTGTSVVGIKYKDGVLLVADMGGSYGSTLRYKSVERLKPVGKHSIVGASGEISDFQEILRYLDELILYDNMWDDGNSLGPKEVHNYLTRVMYNRRNKFNPLWNSLILGGVKNGQKYLGTVNPQITFLFCAYRMFFIRSLEAILLYFMWFLGKYDWCAL
nr:proteasome subunit beta type-4-like [Ipomoea batatas]